jgi:hypothetical protein
LPAINLTRNPNACFLFHPLNQPLASCRLKRFILILHTPEHGRCIEGKDYHFRKKLPQKMRVTQAETIDKMGSNIFLAGSRILIILFYFI